MNQIIRFKRVIKRKIFTKILYRIFYNFLFLCLTIKLFTLLYDFIYYPTEEKITSTTKVLLLPQLKNNIPPFYHSPQTKNITCSILFDPLLSVNYAKLLTKPRRIKFKNDYRLLTDCESIKKRGYFPENALTEDEKNFPIAFARIVYKDYYFLESQFRIEYAPQNSFCYIIDVKADLLFKKRMRNFASCFENVIIPNEEIRITNDGYNMTTAQLICLKYMLKRNWKYAVLLQNHDVKLKTNAEHVKILKNFNGTNDIGASFPEWNNADVLTNSTFAALNLFKKTVLNYLKDDKGNLLSLNLTKSFVQVSLSRAAVNFIFQELNVEVFIEKLQETSAYAIDELFWGTLNSNEFLQIPGGFTHKCLDDGVRVPLITRLAVWDNKKIPIIPCNTKYYRHFSCVFGVDDLINFDKPVHLYINKLLPEYDFAAIECFLEHLYNRTYSNYDISINETFYQNLPQVRYNRHKSLSLPIKDFVCS